MKKNDVTKKLLSLALCGVLLLTAAGCTSKEEQEQEKKNKQNVGSIANPPENTADYFNISYKEWRSEYLFRMASDGVTESESAETAQQYRENTIKYLAQERIVVYLAKDMGITAESFTDEDNKQVEETVNKYLESWYKKYESRAISALGTGYTDQQLKNKEKELVSEFLKGIGLTEEIFTTWAVNGIIHDKFVAKASESVTEDKIKEFVQNTMNEAKNKYETDLADFEKRYTPFYVPEGTRKVQQIAVLINSTSASEVTAYRKDGDNKKADEILNKELEKVKFRIDEAYEKLSKGEEWTKVQEQYNDESSANNVDFTVYPKSTTVLQTITDTAMGIKEKGGFSQPFITDRGYYILYYKDDVTLTDERIKDLNDQAEEFLRNEEAYKPIQEFLDKYPYTYDYQLMEISSSASTTTQTAAVS